MKKIVIVGGVIICLAVVIFLILTTQKDTKATSQVNEKTTVTEGAFAPNTSSNVTGTDSFRKLLSLGKNLSCTLAYTTPGIEGQVEGTSYISGAKMRTNISVVTDIGEIKTSVITDGKTGYSWGTTPMGTMAIKFAVDMPETANTQSQNYQFNLDESVTYSCQNWNVDESFFVPPSDITFMDATAYMQNGATPTDNGDSTKELQCSVCAQIQDDGPRAQCEQTFSCN